MASTTEAAPRKRAPRRPKPVPEIPLTEKVYLTTEELAAFLGGMSPRTLERWRLEGTGPDPISLTAKNILYSRATVDEWMRARERKTRAAAA